MFVDDCANNCLNGRIRFENQGVAEKVTEETS